MLGIVSRSSGYRNRPRDFRMNIVAMTTLTATVNETSLLKIRNEFPYFRRHAISQFRNSKLSPQFMLPRSSVNSNSH